MIMIAIFALIIFFAIEVQFQDYINEANELTFEDWQQLIMRTEDRAILDYNPSDAFHWIYDKVVPRDDCDFFKTTYLDNPFLDSSIRNEIERLRDTDSDYWRIYGLGERGMSRATIRSKLDVLGLPTLVGVSPPMPMLMTILPATLMIGGLTPINWSTRYFHVIPVHLSLEG